MRGHFVLTFLEGEAIYGQASGVPSPPPPMVWSGKVGGEGGRACADRDGAVAARWWGWCWGGQGSHASPTQAINPIR